MGDNKQDKEIGIKMDVISKGYQYTRGYWKRHIRIRKSYVANVCPRRPQNLRGGVSKRRIIMIDKIVRIGTRNKMSIFCHITYDGKKLSITGVEGPLMNGSCRGECGQIYPINVDKFAKGWNQEMLDKFNDIWKEWHLNDLHPGCEHQREMGWEKEFNWNESSKWINKPCPVCGYKYGTSWHAVEVPEEVLKFLSSLPEPDRYSAWIIKEKL